MSSIPSNHFSNTPPFDVDFDPDSHEQTWSPDGVVVDDGAMVTVAVRANRQKKGTMVVAEGDDDNGDIDPVLLNSPEIEEISLDFVSSWNRLISMTNWEKGKLIANWRNRLIERELPRQVYSDESLAKRIGNISGQHIGRLRRVYERFSMVFESYPKLFWSHFQAVLDWEDADQWLNDAYENQWSVATMRLKRWEAIGSPVGQKPHDSDIVMSERDEDVNPYNDSDTVLDGDPRRVEPNDKSKDKKKKRDVVETGEHGDGKNAAQSDDYFGEFSTPAEAFAQMKQLKDLPEDLKEAFEQLKVVILSHKVSGWREVDPQRILTFLNAMKVVVMTEEK